MVKIIWRNLWLIFSYIGKILTTIVTSNLFYLWDNNVFFSMQKRNIFIFKTFYLMVKIKWQNVRLIFFHIEKKLKMIEYSILFYFQDDNSFLNIQKTRHLYLLHLSPYGQNDMTKYPDFASWSRGKLIIFTYREKTKRDKEF